MPVYQGTYYSRLFQDHPIEKRAHLGDALASWCGSVLVDLVAILSREPGAAGLLQSHFHG